MGILESKALLVMAAMDAYSFTPHRATDICHYHGGRLVYTSAQADPRALRFMFEFEDGSQLKLYANGYSCDSKKSRYRPTKVSCVLTHRA